MNIENLEKLAKWLDDGAPEVIFDMNTGNSSVEDMDIWDFRILEERGLVVRDQNGVGKCGTVCCIAGYADFMKNGEKTVQLPGDEWANIRDSAMNILGLEEGYSHNRYMGHDLFDPDLAPHNCTPEQAAVAVRRVIAGEAPWEFDEDEEDV